MKYTFGQEEKNNPWQGFEINCAVGRFCSMRQAIMALMASITLNDNASL
jgi:hypothetical protein